LGEEREDLIAEVLIAALVLMKLTLCSGPMELPWSFLNHHLLIFWILLFLVFDPMFLDV
jgi:hypothetical protein